MSVHSLSLAWAAALNPHRQAALTARLSTLIATLGGPPPSQAGIDELIEIVARLSEPAAAETTWLALSILTGRLPDAALVQRTVRQARLEGTHPTLVAIVGATGSGWPLVRGPWPAVTVVTDTVLVDLHHTARTSLATGIQRVARQSAQRWCRDHQVTLVGWNASLRALRALSPAQARVACFGDTDATVTTVTTVTTETTPHQVGGVLVPWRCTYVLPELMTEPPRSRALQAMLRYSGSTGAMIGFDCVPLTSAETTGDGMGAAFSLMLSAMAHGHRIAPISLAAATEYGGWRTMLAGAGLPGPDIETITLPVEAVQPSARALSEARRLLLSAEDAPMVLCVGSHEPRKNHLAVLHAAELLWREGVRFQLVFIGGNGWRGEQFAQRVAELQRAGRAVSTVRSLADELLWAAYQLARVVVFPSLNEGFGLPVAEALASGTPVVTSDFGSQREIAAEGGALLVDPHEDHAIRDALRTLITDDVVHGELSEQARRRSVRTWEHYAGETWDYLVAGIDPIRRAQPNGPGEL